MKSSYTVRATKENFIVDAELETWDEGKPFFSRTWSHTVPRDGV